MRERLSLPESCVVFFGARLFDILELLFGDALDLKEGLVGRMHDGLDGEVVGLLLEQSRESATLSVSMAWHGARANLEFLDIRLRDSMLCDDVEVLLRSEQGFFLSR